LRRSDEGRPRLTTALELGPGLVRGSLRTGWRLTRRAAGVPVHVARQAGELPGAVLRAAGREAAAERQVWSAGGSAMVEVRALDRDDVDRAALARAVQAHMSGTDGISWARADPATGRIAVRFD